MSNNKNGCVKVWDIHLPCFVTTLTIACYRLPMVNENLIRGIPVLNLTQMSRRMDT